MEELCRSDFGSSGTWVKEVFIMIKVFTGNVYAIQESEYDRDMLLEFFLNGHREEYILIYRKDRLLKALSYYDVLFQRDVPEVVLYLGKNVFAEARAIFFSYQNRDERWNRAAAVCSAQGEVECILYYQQNRTNYNYAISEFETYEYDEGLDFELLSRADAYVFEEYEEYTAFIYEVLNRKFPQKKKIFLDEQAKVFGIESKEELCCNESNVVRIHSKCEKNFFAERYQKAVYSSLDIMTSLFWRKQVSYGSKNPDKKFLLIRFPLYSSGLGDVIRFCMTKVAMAEYRGLEYIPVIDLSISDDGNQFSGGRQENVWEDFFEPLNEYRVEEVKQSQHVLLCDDKLDAFNPYIAEQYFNLHHMRTICRKYLRLNSKMASYVDQVRQKIFSSGNRKVLGVIARGTDYRYGGFDDLPVPMDDLDYIELVRKKMEEWKCEELLLATEDTDILEKFKQADFGGRLKYMDQERYRYTDIHKSGILIVNMQKDTHDYHDEMPYLAVLWLLSECNSIMSNCRCGAYEVADFINGDAYKHRYCYGDAKDC